MKDTIEEQLSFGLKLRGFSDNQIDDWLNKTLKQFDIENYRNKSPYMLSHGQKRLLSVATMLTLGQDILILDEPTFGQDFKSSTNLLNFLKSLNEEGKTIIMITHDMSLVEKYANKVVVMNKGKIIFEGITKDFFKHDEILKEAALTLPPLLKLSKSLAEYDENLRGISSPEEFSYYFNQVE
nr:ABC transporter ATP-binding protein [Methanobrevibacter oralis]